MSTTKRLGICEPGAADDARLAHQTDPDRDVCLIVTEQDDLRDIWQRVRSTCRTVGAAGRRLLLVGHGRREMDTQERVALDTGRQVRGVQSQSP